MKHILTTAQVAQLLGYSGEQVRRLCEDGQLDGDGQAIAGAFRVCVGAHWRVPREAVDHFLAQRAARVRRRSPQIPQTPQIPQKS